MRDKAVGRIAVFTVVGLFLLWITGSGAASAAPATDQTTSATSKPVSLHPSNRHMTRAIRHGSRHAARSNDQKTKVSSAQNLGPSSQDGTKTLVIPASVANANAQMIDNSDAPPDGQNINTAADTSDQQQASPYMVAADQINDIDLAATGLPDPKPVPVSMENKDDTDLSQTSTIGRIFIAIGGLLTIGSAVRLFVV